MALRVSRTYAGEALRDPDVEPFTLAIEDEVAEALRDGDEEAWNLFLAFVEVNIHSQRT
jgi:hypothetical protein